MKKLDKLYGKFQNNARARDIWQKSLDTYELTSGKDSDVDTSSLYTKFSTVTSTEHTSMLPSTVTYDSCHSYTHHWDALPMFKSCVAQKKKIFERRAPSPKMFSKPTKIHKSKTFCTSKEMNNKRFGRFGKSKDLSPTIKSAQLGRSRTFQCSKPNYSDIIPGESKVEETGLYSDLKQAPGSSVARTKEIWQALEAKCNSNQKANGDKLSEMAHGSVLKSSKPDDEGDKRLDDQSADCLVKNLSRASGSQQEDTACTLQV